MPHQIQASQHDFSFGEVDVDLKRADEHPARKGGLRQMSNMRIKNSKTIQNRPGRSALFVATNYGRIEKITMSPGNAFELAFAAGTLSVFNSSGALVTRYIVQGGGAALPWTLLNVGSIVFSQLGLSIYFTFPGMRPQVLSWDGVTLGAAGWTLVDYTELIAGSQKRTWFYRISPQNISLLPGAQTGSTSLMASAPLFVAGHVGTRMRFIGRQMLITAVADSQNATVTIEEAIPGFEVLTFGVDPSATFSIGDVVLGSVTGSKGIVLQINAAAKKIGVQLTSTNSSVIQTSYFNQQIVAFTLADTVVGPSGGLVPTIVDPLLPPQNQCSIWDEEVMNAYRGYPASCFVDNFRLGFCDFPSVPNGIGWSAINSPTDQYVVGPNTPNGAMFEVAPDKVRIYYVVGGPESSEFVFCDHKLYYIKIDGSNPLKPGSVGFQTLSGDGAAHVQPRVAQDVIFYVNAGGNSVMAVVAPGAYYRPFNTDNLCEFHSHLFTNITALAAPNADGTFNERYVYALNANGAIACGKYDVNDGKLAAMGWGPWSGSGAVQWIAAMNADVIFTTTYSGQTICEILDDSQYLDGAIPVNALPAALTPPAGKGPLWWAPGSAVSLMDQGTRSMGIYQIDGSGFIIPLGNGGENLAAASLVAGQSWTSITEPFAPDAQSGADMKQRMEHRQFSKFAVYVINSTGFLFASLFSAKQTRTAPPLGAITSTKRVPAYNMDDDATLPPTLRETVESWTPIGSSYDPRVAIIKDTPGPLLIAEIAMEISI
ncbi:MAG: hypothetical protein JWN43_3421 [Gammaproteobacteria bacterium]|nr:hypothetical protein [Gammaproteobacteria bacterium]